MYVKSDALNLLKQSLKNPNASFRQGQWESIDYLINHQKRIQVVQRTGWGKSSVYFISTKLLRDSGKGITIIISPLLALMRNQLNAALSFGLRAATINSANTGMWEDVKRQVLNNQVDILFISPERLANQKFINNILYPISSNVGLFVVDESHCISDWGHDFRVDYRRIASIVEQMPRNMPVLATTATANDRVIIDVQSQLGSVEILRGCLKRESLKLQNINLPDQPSRLAWLATNLRKIEGTGIIYTLTKRDAKIVTSWLKSRGMNVLPYYSGITVEGFEDSNSYREYLEEKLLNNEVKALVATIALGMGYDKPDLGFVIHYQAPGSIIGYYQQVGRAGRGVDKAYGILLSGREDDDIHEFFRRSAFPPKDRIDAILEALEQEDGGLSIPELTQKINFRRGQIEHTLKYLSVENPSPVYNDRSKWKRAPTKFEMDYEKIVRLTHQREIEWQEVKDYINHEGCLMQYLQRSLDDPTASNCGICANCRGVNLLPTEIDLETGKEAASFIKKTDLPLNLKKQIPSGALAIYGWRGNLPYHLRGQEGRILSRWKDAGWGTIVARNKHQRHFENILVDAMYNLIVERWSPNPFPEWVTCVPSINNPDLVPDFASRLAKKLGLPFHNIIKKIKNNGAQKNQENRYYQCENLDGVFEIQEQISNKSVLLVDDAVDSGWTLTILAALLLQGGSGAVFPVALTTTNIGG